MENRFPRNWFRKTFCDDWINKIRLNTCQRSWSAEESDLTQQKKYHIHFLMEHLQHLPMNCNLITANILNDKIHSSHAWGRHALVSLRENAAKYLWLAFDKCATGLRPKGSTFGERTYEIHNVQWNRFPLLHCGLRQDNGYCYWLLFLVTVLLIQAIQQILHHLCHSIKWADRN